MTSKRRQENARRQRRDLRGRWLPLPPEPQTRRPKPLHKSRIRCHCGLTFTSREKYEDHWYEKHVPRKQKEEEQ